MIKLSVAPFEKEVLVEGLTQAFPQYKIKTGMGAFQVRTKNFTVTGNVQLKIKPKKGEVTTQTNYDMRIAYLIISFPLALYIMSKKDKQKAMEKEVADMVVKILK